MFETSDQLQFIISAIITAVVGGIANWFMSDEHTVFQFVTAVFLAGFAGFLVGELCIEYTISNSWTFFFCGASGLSAEFILKLSRKILVKKIAAITDQNLDDELEIIDLEYKRKKAELLRKKLDKECEEEVKSKNNLEKFLDDEK